MIQSNGSDKDRIRWTKADRSDLCAGIFVPCFDHKECTATTLGPCSNLSHGPEFYVELSQAGMLLVGNLSQYTLDSNQVTELPVSSHGSNGSLYYRDFEQDIVESDKKYTYTMSGALYGSNPGEFGAYSGIAASFAQSGSIEYTRTSIYMASDAIHSPVLRKRSLQGAPLGPYHACAVSIIWKNGTRPYGICDRGNPATIREGTYKFSIFGTRLGTHYGTQPLPNGKSPEFVVARMKLRVEGKDSAAVSFQSWIRKPYSSLQALGGRDVRTMEISNSKHGVIKIVFPPTYNVGELSAGSVTETATKIARIKISEVEDGFYVDYLFPIYDIVKKDKWFLYDPDVTASSNPYAYLENPAADDAGVERITLVVAVILVVIIVLLLCALSSLLVCWFQRFRNKLRHGQRPDRKPAEAAATPTVGSKDLNKPRPSGSGNGDSRRQIDL